MEFNVQLFDLKYIYLIWKFCQIFWPIFGTWWDMYVYIVLHDLGPSTGICCSFSVSTIEPRSGVSWCLYTYLFGIETSPDCQIAAHCVLFLQDVRTPEHVYRWVSTTTKNNIFEENHSPSPKKCTSFPSIDHLKSTPCLMSSWTWNPVTRSYWSDRGALIIHKNHVEWSMFNDFLSQLNHESVWHDHLMITMPKHMMI